MSQIEVLRDDPQYKVYRTSCECMDDDHTITINIEADLECDQVVLEMYCKTWENTRSWSDNPVVSVYQSLKKRLSVACRVLFLGYTESTTGFIFRGDDHIDAFCDTIQKAKSDIKRVI